MLQRDEWHRPAKGPHLCPWWLGPLLANPLRRLIESPERLLEPHVDPGMTVLEPGCGMGFFTIPLARMVGPHGRVVVVDVQSRMVQGLLRRARRAGVDDRVEAFTGTLDDVPLSLRGAVDLAAALYVTHEVPDQTAFLTRIHDLLRPGGRLLLVEPKGHVKAAAFSDTLVRAAQVGFLERERPSAPRGWAALLELPPSGSTLERP